MHHVRESELALVEREAADDKATLSSLGQASVCKKDPELADPEAWMHLNADALAQERDDVEHEQRWHKDSARDRPEPVRHRPRG